MALPLVANDQVTGQCAIHLIPNPATGAPQPSPPLPFTAPLTVGLATTVLIGGKAAAVLGSSGANTPPHVGLHPSDPFLVPPMQQGLILTGSPTVLLGGQPAATTDSTCSCCGIPGGTAVPSVTTVTIG
ncbi:MAG: PAAR domain-containing protein [Chloroflexi bacterium]|nr:PAAR domain-containing protein [Chloroflexota bacterium]